MLLYSHAIVQPHLRSSADHTGCPYRSQALEYWDCLAYSAVHMCFRTSVLCHNTARVGETFHIVHVLFPNSDWMGSSSSTDLHLVFSALILRPTFSASVSRFVVISCKMSIFLPTGWDRLQNQGQSAVMSLSTWYHVWTIHGSLHYEVDYEKKLEWWEYASLAYASDNFKHFNETGIYFHTATGVQIQQKERRTKNSTIKQHPWLDGSYWSFWKTVAGNIKKLN